MLLLLVAMSLACDITSFACSRDALLSDATKLYEAVNRRYGQFLIGAALRSVTLD